MKNVSVKLQMKQNLKQPEILLAALKRKLPALIVLIFVIGGAGILVSKFSSSTGTGSKVDVKVPTLSTVAKVGEKAFAKNCAKCHGNNAAGGPGGPPLVHAIYNPGHHGDMAFILAMQRGTQQHHWRFGNMPPQPQVNQTDAKAIIRYIRELQVANNIIYRRH